jgi:nucleoside-diphosphate-sugar epimerase
MRVLVAGATGVIGRQLTPLLAAIGHEVTALTRPAARPAAEASGVRTVTADLLDAQEVRQAVHSVAPEAVVHIATAIPNRINPRRLAADFATTNRLRTEGTRHLLTAAADAGVRRVITEGLAYAYDPAGTEPATEEDPLWKDPPKQFAPVLAALRDLEAQTLAANGLVLRLGHLYGPGSIYDVDGSFAAQVRAGKVPLVGGGTAMFSFTHAYDAATAIVAALDKDVVGVLNIVDNHPTPMSEWLPEFAALLEAKKPKEVPAALAWLAVGGWGVAFMTKLRGADNARARLALDWKPRYDSWQTGLVETFIGPTGARQRG